MYKKLYTLIETSYTVNVLKIDRLKQLLEQQGRTRTWLARSCRVSRITVTSWLCGIRNPSPPSLKLMADALGVPEVELIKEYDWETQDEKQDEKKECEELDDEDEG